MQVDILRYEILLQIGGLYVDMDIKRLGNFEDIHPFWDFYVGLASQDVGTVEINNALIGSIPEHDIIRDVLDHIYKHKSKSFSATKTVLSNINLSSLLDDSESHTLSKILNQHSIDSVITETGPGLFTKIVLKSKDCFVFPSKAFYPLPNTKRGKAEKYISIDATSYAVHYWGCKWQT